MGTAVGVSQLWQRHGHPLRLCGFVMGIAVAVLHGIIFVFGHFHGHPRCLCALLRLCGFVMGFAVAVLRGIFLVFDNEYGHPCRQCSYVMGTTVAVLHLWHFHCPCGFVMGTAVAVLQLWHLLRPRGFVMGIAVAVLQLGSCSSCSHFSWASTSFMQQPLGRLAGVRACLSCWHALVAFRTAGVWAHVSYLLLGTLVVWIPQRLAKAKTIMSFV